MSKFINLCHILTSANRNMTKARITADAEYSFSPFMNNF